MPRVICLSVMVGFFGMVLVIIQEPFRNYATPFPMALDLALATTCRAFGALIATVTTIDLLLRVTSGKEVTNVSNWVIVILSALCLFTPTWAAPLGLTVVTVAVILASKFGRGDESSTNAATTDRQSSENPADFKDWEQT